MVVDKLAASPEALHIALPTGSLIELFSSQ
jgi:hypothetical protein